MPKFATAGAGETAAAEDRTAYIQITGAFFYDADGSGAGVAVQFAPLQGAPIATASDFTII